jgi:hypothetical protein
MWAELREQFDAFINELLAAQARHVREAVLGKERELLREWDFDGFFKSFEKLGHRE